MRRALLLASLLVVLLPLGGAAVGEEKSLEGRVNVAIDRSAAELVARQAEDGSWNKQDKVHPLGRTALCTFALLHAGYPQDHAAVRKALKFLRIDKGYASPLKPISIYEAGCLVLLLNALGKGHERTIKNVCQWICDNYNTSAGIWGYPGGTPDLSNTQYAAMALKAGRRHGFETPKGIWKRLINATLALQAECGAFRYRPGTMYRATMTHAALLVLRFAHEGLGTKPTRKIRDAMKRGHRWIEETYSVERNPYGKGWSPNQYYYYMYGVERYAQYFGKKTIDGHDWYREGAEVLLSRQKKNGGWGNLEETCFAILFLRRATLTEPEERVGGAADGGDGDWKDPPRKPRPDKTVPYIREWLVAGPFPTTKHEDDQLYVKHMNVKRVVPRVGGPAGKQKWVLHRAKKDKVKLTEAVRSEAWAAYFAAVWIHLEKDAEVLFWLGSEDGMKAYVDGKEIVYGNHRGWSGPDHYRVPMPLKKGRHLLLIWVGNLEYDAYVQARISDAEGKPLTGVRVGASRK